jgi:hypothetical protein
MNFRTTVFTFLTAILFMAVPAFAQKAGDNGQTLTPTDQSIEVERFDVKEGIDFPASSVDVIMTEIVDELTKLKKFRQVRATTVLASPAKPAAETGTTTSAPETDPTPEKANAGLLLTGTITKYKPGNRAMRYFVGFGAGTTRIVASIKLVEKATGKVILEQDVDGKVIIGLFGGDSSGAARGLASGVARVTKKAVFKK